MAYVPLYTIQYNLLLLDLMKIKYILYYMVALNDISQVSASIFTITSGIT